jgi:hypothetical protein
MKSQATRYTDEQLDVIAHWEAKGYTFAPGELPPFSKHARPSWSSRHPRLDALLSLALIAAGAATLVVLLVGLCMGLVQWPQ